MFIFSFLPIWVPQGKILPGKSIDVQRIESGGYSDPNPSTLSFQVGETKSCMIFKWQVSPHLLGLSFGPSASSLEETGNIGQISSFSSHFCLLAFHSSDCIFAKNLGVKVTVYVPVMDNVIKWLMISLLTMCVLPLGIRHLNQNVSHTTSKMANLGKNYNF